jgi:hypothetical protein
MSLVRDLGYSEAGVRKKLIIDGDKMHCTFEQDAEPVLKHTMRQQNDYVHDRHQEFRKVASIPMGLYLKWLKEEGFDALDPENNAKLMQRLNGEYKWLKTTPKNL